VEKPRSPKPGEPASAFLVERYLPASAVGTLASSVAYVARICGEQTGGSAVRYLQSIYLPADDICFCLFQALSGDAVRSVNDAGRFSLDRITEAVLLIT
jgi:uncharacterized protein DUF4242